MSKDTPVIVLLALVATMMLGGCDESVEHPTDLEPVVREQTRSVDTVVIKVNDREVGTTAFEAYWRDHAETPRAEAIDGFVEQEVLLGPALDGGYAGAPEVAVARKRGMVRRLLEETVESDITPGSLDQDEITNRMDQIEAQVGHPPGLSVSHILVMVPRDKKKKGKKKEKPQLSKLERQKAFDDAQALLDEIRATLPASPTPVNLYLAERTFAKTVEEPLRVDMNAYMKFPAVGDSKSSLPDGWLNVVPEFREAAVELAQDEVFGQLSEPVRTPFGWHLLVVHEVLPGARPDPEVVREVAIAQLLRQKRSNEVIDRYNTWAEGVSLETYPRVIEEAEQLE